MWLRLCFWVPEQVVDGESQSMRESDKVTQRGVATNSQLGTALAINSQIYLERLMGVLPIY